MIARYSLPKMAGIWSERNRFAKMLDVEIAACEAMAELGLIPAKDIKIIKEKASFNVERIKQIVDGRIVSVIPEPADGQRQFLPKYYVRNGSIYVVRRDSLDRLFGHENSLAYIMPPERGVNIDDANDWLLAEDLLKTREGIA